MDWNKTKTIFIVVFLILNVFLYYQYLSSYNEAQKVELLIEKKIDAMLQDDNIKYSDLPNVIKTAPYISTKVKTFTKEDLPESSNQSGKIIENNKFQITFKKPIYLGLSVTKDRLNEFSKQYIPSNDAYILWEINSEEKYALFFQRVNDKTFYYNVNGYIKLYWNDNNEVTHYEQTMLEKIEALEQQEIILQPLEVLEVLYARNLLKPNSTVTTMNLGYSTFVQITETQVFTPTWEVRVKLEDGKEEILFINAVAGKVIEFDNTDNELNTELGE